MRKKGVTNRRPRFREVKPPSTKAVLVKLLVPWCDKDYLVVGRVIEHPQHGLVYITEGAMWVDGRLSNFWSWRKVRRDVLTGPTLQGYGYEFDHAYWQARSANKTNEYFDGNHGAQD